MNNPTGIRKSDAEWRTELTPEQYRITREHGTEFAFTSSLNAEKRDGVYSCVCCGEALFAADAKYDSGSGWPSFFAPLSTDAVGQSTDRSLLMTRTEVHCARCGAHLGHLFPDGPAPTGLRYCVNGVSLDFKPKE